MFFKKILIDQSKNTIILYLIGVFFLMLALAAPWFNISIANHTFVKSYFAVIGSGIIFLVSIFNRLSTQSEFLKLTHLKVTALLLFIFGAFSILWSVNIDFYITKFLLWLSAFFCFIVGLNLDTRRESIIKISWILILSGSLIAIVGILQHFFQPFSLTQASRIASTFGNKNAATQVLVLILPFSFFLFFSKISTKSIWMLSTLTSLILIYVLYTQTRAAWISIMFELMLLSVLVLFNFKKVKELTVWNKSKRKAFMTSLIFVLIMTNLTQILNPEKTLKTNSQAISSIGTDITNLKSPRYYNWKTSVNMLLDRPIIGSGLGSFSHNIGTENYANLFTRGLERSHNDILELGVELGFLGLLILFTLIVSIITTIITVYKKTNLQYGLFYYVIFVSLSGLFLNMQVSFPFQMPLPIILFGFFLGLLAKKYDEVNASKKQFNITMSSRIKNIFFGVWCIIILLISLIYINWIKVYDDLNKVNFERDYKDLSFLNTTIIHSDLPNILSRTSRSAFNQNDYQTSEIIDQYILNYWPNHTSSIFRLGYSSHQKNKNSQALKYAERLKKIEPAGLYGSYIIKLLVYSSNSSTKDSDKFQKTFLELYSIPDDLLAIDKNTYHYLLFFTLESEELSKYAPVIYQKYINENVYSCQVENNIAIYYFNEELFNKSAKHVKNVLEISKAKIINNTDDSDCLNQSLVKLLEEKKLL